MILNRFSGYLLERVLDLGCGDGLATKWLDSSRLPNVVDIVGVDVSRRMAERYEREARRPAFVANFWDRLPKARSAVAVYSFHLCPPSRRHEVFWRLHEAGVRHLVVVSPLKNTVEGWGLIPVESFSTTSKAAGDKTVWSWVFEIAYD